jgi:6-phosphogluconolactonase
MDDNGKYVFASNYGGGSVTAVPVNSDGSLSSDIQTIVHQPKSGNTGRQQGSHAHAAVLSADNKFLIVPDLGTDKINIYRVDLTKSSNPLTPSDPAFLAVKDGSGPRHFIFSTDSRYAYLIHELQGFISVYDFKDGILTEKQTITLLSDDFKGRIGGADIHISPDNKFLYASNRGDADEIVIFKILKDGKLQPAGRQSTIGKHPRNFAIDPTGNFLLVGNNTTDDVTVFKRDKKTGLLTPANKTFPVVQPGCLKFVTE